MKNYSWFALSALFGAIFAIAPAKAQEGDPTNAPNARPAAPSLRAHLQLKAQQIDALNQIYDEWTTKHSDVSQAHDRALKILTPLQHAQLAAIAREIANNSNRLRIRDDQYSQLLLPPFDQNNIQFSQQRTETPSDNSRPKKSARSRRPKSSGGSYGVYGGYSYGGPNYGVYGNYGRGNVGVSGSIGRYGPSIGVNIGRVFGSRWLR